MAAVRSTLVLALGMCAAWGVALAASPTASPQAQPKPITSPVTAQAKASVKIQASASAQPAATQTPSPRKTASPTPSKAAQPSAKTANPSPSPTASKAKAAAKTAAKTAAKPPAKAEACFALLHSVPGVSSQLCAQAQLQTSGALSVQGRPLLLRDMPAAATVKNPTRVLVIGGIHGDELSSVNLALQWIGLASEIPAQSHWRFLPALNPDGLLAKKPSRTNAHGVDLNRNFPTPNWENEAAQYWGKRTKKDPRRWPGDKPLSEPESKLVFDQMASFAPQLIVSIHAPYGVLDFDGPTIPPEKLGRLYLDQIGIYPGSLGNYAGVHRGIPVVTIELPHASRPPSAAETRQMWLDLLRWMAARGF